MLDERAPKTATRPPKPKVPKPTIGFISVPRDWNPRSRDGQVYLWDQHPSRAAAEADRDHADWLGCEPRMIVQVDTAFTIVDDGGSDG